MFSQYFFQKYLFVLPLEMLCVCRQHRSLRIFAWNFCDILVCGILTYHRGRRRNARVERKSVYYYGMLYLVSVYIYRVRNRELLVCVCVRGVAWNLHDTCFVIFHLTSRCTTYVPSASICWWKIALWPTAYCLLELHTHTHISSLSNEYLKSQLTQRLQPYISLKNSISKRTYRYRWSLEIGKNSYLVMLSIFYLWLCLIKQWSTNIIIPTVLFVQGSK